MASLTNTSLSASTISSSSKNSEDNKKQRKRKMLLQELIHTEETYVAALQKLVKVFIEPLSLPHGPQSIFLNGQSDRNRGSGRRDSKNNNMTQRSPKALRALSVLQTKYGGRGIFQGMNAKEICGLNESLLSDLKKNIGPLLSAGTSTNEENKCVNVEIAYLFLRYTPQMAMYSVYCESHQTMLERIEVARDYDCVDVYLSELEQQAKCSLLSLLIQPVQRIPRYRMLLLELIKNSEDRSSDSSALLPLQQALDAISEIAQRVNGAFIC